MPLAHGHDATKTLLALTALMVVNNGLPPGRAMIMRCMMVGKRGFEPPAPASRRQCSTRLSYSPTESDRYALGGPTGDWRGAYTQHFAAVQAAAARSLRGMSKSTGALRDATGRLRRDINAVRMRWEITASGVEPRQVVDDGAPRAIRTPDPQIRSLMLYPAELWVHRHAVYGRPVSGRLAPPRGRKSWCTQSDSNARPSDS